ncbi:hypothetical protein MVEN_02306600 [Mycena venus]|uniref:Uncharacterized protein n=1 Tax=Mycena venus TaxID=2733690 RepID=A0A8H7CDW5_9AGAR|nr:hypothetical protein MVEN_02306600 [Mycena venus]
MVLRHPCAFPTSRCLHHSDRADTRMVRSRTIPTNPEEEPLMTCPKHSGAPVGTPQLRFYHRFLWIEIQRTSVIEIPQERAGYTSDVATHASRDLRRRSVSSAIASGSTAVVDTVASYAFHIIEEIISEEIVHRGV